MEKKETTVTFRLSKQEKQKLVQLGMGAWIRKKIKAARVPQRIEGEKT